MTTESGGRLKEFAEKYVEVLYDYEYENRDKRLVRVWKGETLLLLKCNNDDWWLVFRGGEKRAFHVPVKYVREIPLEEGRRRIPERLSHDSCLGSNDSSGLAVKTSLGSFSSPGEKVRDVDSGVIVSIGSTKKLPIEQRNDTDLSGNKWHPMKFLSFKRMSSEESLGKGSPETPSPPFQSASLESASSMTSHELVETFGIKHPVVLQTGSHDRLLNRDVSREPLFDSHGKPIKAASSEELDANGNSEKLFKSNQLSHRHRSNSVDLKVFSRDLGSLEVHHGVAGLIGTDKARKPRLCRDIANRRRSWAVDDTKLPKGGIVSLYRRSVTQDEALVLDVPPKLPPKLRQGRNDSVGSCGDSGTCLDQIGTGVNKNNLSQLIPSIAPVMLDCNWNAPNYKLQKEHHQRRSSDPTLLSQVSGSRDVPVALPRKIIPSRVNAFPLGETTRSKMSLESQQENVNGKNITTKFGSKQNKKLHIQLGNKIKDVSEWHQSIPFGVSLSPQFAVSEAASTQEDEVLESPPDSLNSESFKQKSNTSLLPPSPTSAPRRNLFDGWGEHVDMASNRPFFFNQRTREKRWKPPRKNVNALTGTDNEVSPISNKSNEVLLPSPSCYSPLRDTATPHLVNKFRLSPPRVEGPPIPPTSAKPIASTPTSSLPSDALFSTHHSQALLDALDHLKPPLGWRKRYDAYTQRIYFQSVINGERWLANANEEQKLYFYKEDGSSSQWMLPPHTEAELSQIRNAESLMRPPVCTYERIRISLIPENLPKLAKNSKMEGFLHRTFFLRDGKKVRKNWSLCYVRYLHGTFSSGSLGLLIFTKSAEDDKKVELFDLFPTCHLEQAGEKKTSRHHTMALRNGHFSEMLLQADDREAMQRWFACLSEHDGMQVTTSTSSNDKDDRKGRKGSEKLKIESSVENLSSNENQKGIRDKLRFFIKRRPTQDSLVKKGIYKELIFGSTLTQLCSQDKTNVPLFVLLCIKNIEKSDINLCTDGLYRISGNAAQIQKIRYEVGQRNYNILAEEKEVHNLAGALKLFFRELKEPLIPWLNYQSFIQATGSEFRRTEKQPEMLMKAVRQLPVESYETLKLLLRHLIRVSEFESSNRMSLMNLAIVFGPCLLWPEVTASHDLMTDVMLHNRVIEGLLNAFSVIFTW